MKIVLDMNISPTWVPFLNDAGYETIHWSKVGDIRAEDSEIMKWAEINKFIVFAHDLDFSSLLYATGAKAPSVVQLRTENILPSSIGDAVLETLNLGLKHLESGSLITIDPRRHRIRILPLTK